MKKVLNKIRRNAGVLLESLLILFIVANSFTEVTAKKKTDETLSYKASVSNLIVLRDAQTNLSTGSSVENILTFDWAFSEFIIDLPTKVLLTHKVFFFSAFERNAFYVFNSASAP